MPAGSAPTSSSGTEAALHQLDGADVVAFLDFDQELLAPRYRAAEEALALLVLGARLVGGAGPGTAGCWCRPASRTTRSSRPRCSPTRAGSPTRRPSGAGPLGYPPATAMAVVSGASAPAWVDGVRAPRRRRGARARPTAGGWSAPPTTPRSATRWPPRPGRRAGCGVEVDPQRL